MYDDEAANQNQYRLRNKRDGLGFVGDASPSRIVRSLSHQSRIPKPELNADGYIPFTRFIDNTLFVEEALKLFASRFM
jgi:hypothetical protein